MEGATLSLSEAGPALESVTHHAPERRVLIVEPDSESVAALKSKLAQAGFTVRTLTRGEDARVAIDREHPHLVMLDWDLPTVIAMDLVRHVRRDASVKGPRLIALSSFSSEQHVCSGFELGLDDYVVKPFSVPELVARVRALLRPLHDAHQGPVVLRFRELEMDTGSGRLTFKSRPVNLRNMEFRLLEYLMRAPERAFSRDTLLRAVWGGNGRTGMRAIDVTVQRIRRALARDGGHYLQTVRGLGYRLSASNSQS
jgi:two-component system phosphate regulon response regulator PhoB